MKAVEKTGKTIEEAIEFALSELNLERNEVEIEVIEEPSRGFLGLLGSKPARVKVIEKLNPNRYAIRFLEDVIQSMGLEAEMRSITEEDQIKVNMSGPDTAILIGRRGETLDSLQYLMNLAINKKVNKRIRIILDIDGYREKRAQSLYQLAQRLSERVKKTGNRIVLEPMSPQERRLIHTALQDDQSVITFSEGDEPHRKVVIAPKK